MKILFLTTVLTSLLIVATCAPKKDEVKYDPNKLHVHLVPHTHNDVGWLKTVDQYYYGANVTIQQGAVQYIIDGVVQELLKDPSKKFIYVEMAFFTRWWNEQGDYMREQVKMLVKERRLEFILGGWCMNDEASTHYAAIIDQMTVGLQFIQQTFGDEARPTVAWQIDPFGHSREQASLFAQMGFDGLFFGRLDYQDKEKREKERNMEGIWRGSANLQPPHADLFTGVNQNGYNPPDGFCFDQYCADQPVMDDPTLHDYNLDYKIQLFIKRATDQAKHYATNHIMWTMGSDFQYSNANMWFKNMDKIIKYVNNATSNITTFYSTPSIYLNALHAADNQWSVKHDDFFPYAEAPHSFWTGYFTSRPLLKRYTRETSAFLQACTQIESQMMTSSTSSWKLRKAMGVAQHHDAVSGTSKQHVANDYALRLYNGREECKKVIAEAMSLENKLIFCDYLNISKCEFTQNNDNFLVIVYNPLARKTSKYVTIPLMTSQRESEVRHHATGDRVARQHNIMTSQSNELVFRAEMDPMSSSVYEVMKTNKLIENKDETINKNSENLTISNELLIYNFKNFKTLKQFYQVEFHSNGSMSKLTNLKSKISTNFKQNFYLYNSSVGDAKSFQQSGAYVFRPNSSELFPCQPSTMTSQRPPVVTRTPLYERLTHTTSRWCRQVVTLYKGLDHVHVKFTVGPIPIDDGLGKEVITKYETEIKNDGIFYTDSNGREMLERKIDYRPTWNFNNSEEVAGNYYPINTRAYIRDDQSQLTVLNDRSQGGSSLKSGQIEIMIHRRVLGEDGKGVGEALNETSSDGEGIVVEGSHYLMFDTPANSGKKHRILGEKIFMQNVVAFAEMQNIPQHISLMNEELPQNVHLLTLSTTSDGSTLIRLEHQFEIGEDFQLSQPATVNIRKILKNFTYTDIQEVSLAANANIENVNRLKWKSKENKRSKREVLEFTKPRFKSSDKFTIILQPMQIRSFILN